ncbi:MAG: tRNA (adenosine(37)-N6)-threonylcarbamoyltransferase complex dimerization subunit type 1 TsaB [Holophagaceae bacterium]|jgi:tRNA threonylcarbamoyladenosine biosynthesis protein TsaB
MILALDSATDILYLSVHNDRDAFSLAVPSEQGKRHSVLLMQAIESLFSKHHLVPGQIQGIVCGVGPGGFTSLRVGVATAEGLAIGGLPTWGFTSFEFRHAALRLNQPISTCWIALEGQRGDLFVQQWNNQSPLTSPSLMSIPNFKEAVGHQSWWAPRSVLPKLSLNSPPLALSGEEETVMLRGLLEIARSKTVTPPQKPLIPVYIRETDAEIQLRSSQDGTQSS